MKKCLAIIILIISVTSLKAQTDKSLIVLKRTDTMRFEKDSLFGFAINPSLMKSNLVWKRKNDIVLNQISQIFKSRCDAEILFCNVYKYVPVCDHSPKAAQNILDNMRAYLEKKCGIPPKNIITTAVAGGGPEDFIYGGISVPYVEIEFRTGGSHN